MMRVAPEAVAFRIISRLNYPDFVTDAGIRTVSRDSLDYDPYGHWGLLGGIWPGVTWWYAFAAANYHPEFMVKALRASFEHYNRDPKQYNTVPGQFSEWFDGQSLINRGMRLSPWEPPRFLWAAVEGICGVVLRPDQPTIRPLIPDSWKWVALHRLPFHDRLVTYFAARQPDGMRIFTDTDVATEHELERYERDATLDVQVKNPSIHHVVLERPGEILVALGNTELHTSVAPVQLERVVDRSRRYTVDLYNSERGAWTDAHSSPGEDLTTVVNTVEAGGYRILRMREQ
jgi:hypothetical protein